MKKYRDVLIEQFVRETRPQIVLLPRFLAYVAVVTLTMATALITLYLLTEYFFVATIFVFILSFLISTPFRKKKYIEYEYSFLDGDFKICKIQIGRAHV